MNKIDCLILGGGITGLSFANFYDGDYLILEKNEEVGGYCRTKISGEYVWDYSGHFFHFRDSEIEKFITKNIKCKIHKVKKKSKIFYKSKYIDFPFQSNIHQLEKQEFIDCLVDLYNTEEVTVDNFEDLSNSIFGKSISEKFILPYNKKLYACDLKKLDYKCMGRFLPKSNFVNVMDSISGRKLDTYNDTFIYPEFGCFEFVKSILTDLDDSKIKTKTKVTKIDIEKKIAYTNTENIIFDKLISTIPFDKFLKLTGEEDCKLTSNKVLVFNIGFDKPSNFDYHWIYFPGDEIFYRVGFYDNIMDSDKMSIYVEIGLSGDTEYDENQIFNKIIKDLKKSKIITNQKVVDYQSILMDPAYVHITDYSNRKYNDWCNKNNKDGIYSIGRYGSWTYCSIEDNIIQSKKLANLL
jgi:protoporphyrinogen oxidase